MIPRTDPFADLEPAVGDELAGIADQVKPDKAERTIGQILDHTGVSALIEDNTIDQVVACLKVLALEAKDLDDLGSAAIREAAIKKLQGIGTRSPAQLVDSAFALYAPKRDDGRPGITLVEPLPWPDPVQGSALLTNIADVFCTYAVLPATGATALALWTVLTYLVDAVWVLPLMVVASPEKRCGKTLILELLGAMVLRPLPASNISVASLFRVVEKYRPSLLIDEADSFFGKDEELRGIINSGHRRSAAFVLRCEGDNNEPQQFSTWGPKAIATIGKLADTLEDRSIIIRMQRKTAADQVARLRSDRIGAELEGIRRQAARWARDHAAAIRDADPAVPAKLNDRAADNWRPLLAIADCAQGSWPALAREAAVELWAETEDGSLRVQLLEDIRSIFADRSAERISSEDLARSLEAIEDRPWPEFRNGKPITPRQIARLLKPFGVEPRQIRFELGNVRGYLLQDLQDALSRYVGVIPSATPLQASIDAGLRQIPIRYSDEGCSR